MREVFKWIFGLLVSFRAIVVLSPVFAVIAIAIRVGSKGSAVFKQERVGKNGDWKHEGRSTLRKWDPGLRNVGVRRGRFVYPVVTT